MQKAVVAGNAQYIAYTNSDENRQQISPDTQKSTSRKSNPLKKGELKVEKRFKVNWKFYKGEHTGQKRLQIAA